MATVTSEYPTTLTINDLTGESSVGLNASTYTTILRYQVGRRQRVFFGNGSLYLGNDTRGTFTANLNTSAPADIQADIRVLYEDVNGVRSVFLRGMLYTDYESGVKVGKGGDTGLANNGQRLLFAPENDYIVFEARTVSGTATYSKADSTCFVPITVQTLSA